MTLKRNGYSKVMKTLKPSEIMRQDFVDSAIFKLIQSINPSNHSIAWNIEMIGDVRDALEDWLVVNLKICTEQDFYPFIEDRDGN